MEKITKIELNLSDFKITIHHSDESESLVTQFDTPSRRFYFSLIALVVNEMKKQELPKFIHIRKYQSLLELLDKSLSGKHASKNTDSMWAKINMAWRHRLPDLETAALFKILDRDLIAPYEKGGKYRYECAEADSDLWASLFDYDENNKWRFKFAIDRLFINLSDIDLKLGDLRGNDAWEKFLKTQSYVEAPISDTTKKAKHISYKNWKKMAIAVVAILFVFSVGITLYQFLFQKSLELIEIEIPDRPSIAVLPFTNIGKDPDQDYLVDGITESIITSLAKVPKMLVIARNSTFIYKGKPVKAQDVSRELGVRYILEGGVQKSGDNLRTTTQLIDAVSGYHIWSEQYDMKIKDIFTLQDEITMKVIKALQVELTVGEVNSLRTKGTKNLNAYLKYLQGYNLFVQMNPKDNIKSRQRYEEAINLDPNFTEAYIGLGQTYEIQIKFGGSESYEKLIEKTRELLEKAKAIDELHPYIYRGYASLYPLYNEWDKAVEAAKRAYALAPNDLTCINRLAAVLEQSGRHEEAIEYCKLALRINPLFPVFTYALMGGTYLWMKQYEKAIFYLEKCIEITPNRTPTILRLAACYEAVGRKGDARSTVARALALNPKITVEKYLKGVKKKDFYLKQWLGKLLREAGLPLNG